jgi:hypothetical protein
MPVNDNGTTTLEDIVVTGHRAFTVFPPAWPEPLEHDTTELEAPDPRQEAFQICGEEAALDQAGLEAGARTNSASGERGFVLIREPDGSVRAYGPIEGVTREGTPQIDWPLNPSVYGLTDLSTVIGLVHNHPRIPEEGGTQSTARRTFSEHDVQVNAAFAARGVSSDFRQYISVGGSVYRFGLGTPAGTVGVTPVVAATCVP